MADYATVPLVVDEIGIAAAQMNPLPVDANKAHAGRRRNLDQFLYLCDQAQVIAGSWPRGKAHLVVFPEPVGPVRITSPSRR